MGNVLLEWNARKNIAQVEPDAERADKLEKVVFASGIWERQDTGELTVEEALNLVKEQLDDSFHEAVTALFTDWYRHVEIYREMQDVAIQLSRQGYDIYVLSNTSAVYYAIEQAGYLPITQVLSGKVLSFEEGLIKPDSAVFHLLLDRYQLDPETCVFIDDIAGSILAAEKLGMTGILCQNSQQVIRDLQILLGIS